MMIGLYRFIGFLLINGLLRLAVTITLMHHVIHLISITLSLAQHSPRAYNSASDTSSTLSMEIPMSFIPIPVSVAWLQTANDETVQYEHFVQCAYDHAEWLKASGVPESNISNPATFVTPGDLQTLSNVVSWWPKDAPNNYAAPTLYQLLQDLRHNGVSLSFADSLAWYVERIKEWMRVHKFNVDNPNETKGEREARLNRERVARHRVRHSPEASDPELAAFQRAHKEAMESLAAGQKWMKQYEKETKAQLKVDIANAKAAQSQKMKEAFEHVAAAAKRSEDAKLALDTYIIHNRGL